jgi:glycosyltransferase involved in cell wall biosynthesis
MNPLISIVILSYSDRRLPSLRDLLSSVEEQTYKFLELVFIVERSVGILKFVSEWKSKYPKRIYFIEQKTSVADCRNIAVSIATGDIIAFVDDDAKLTEGWANEMAATFQNHPSIIGVTGAIIPDWEIESDSDSFPKSLYWMIGCTAWRDSSTRYYLESAQTLNTAYRREVFCKHKFRIRMYKNEEAASLFSGLQGDDVDFALRVTSGTSRKLLYDPHLVVKHKVPHARVELEFVKRYAFWQGYTEARYSSLKLAKSRRSTVFNPLLRTLANDLFGGSWLNLRLKTKIIMALAFFAFGYLWYMVTASQSKMPFEN